MLILLALCTVLRLCYVYLLDCVIGSCFLMSYVWRLEPVARRFAGSHYAICRYSLSFGSFPSEIVGHSSEIV